jgi:multiple sugar transport system ATP-binding protein
MNLLEATLVGTDGALAVELGEFRLAVPPDVVDARPALRGYSDRKIVLGIRPENMEDAALVSDAPADRRIASGVELREALGSDVVVHFKVKAPQAMTEDVRELAVDVGQEALDSLQDEAQVGETNVVARLDPRTRVRQGDEIELVVDTHRLHFFDIEDGSGIYEGKES